MVVEHLLFIKRELLSPDHVSTDTICEHLNYLLSKLPSIEILKETRLGKVVKSLCKHSNPNVSDAANKVVQLWTDDIRRRKSLTYLEVRCDKKTETLRNSARNLLKSALELKVFVMVLSLIEENISPLFFSALSPVF